MHVNELLTFRQAALCGRAAWLIRCRTRRARRVSPLEQHMYIDAHTHTHTHIRIRILTHTYGTQLAQFYLKRVRVTFLALAFDQGGGGSWGRGLIHMRFNNKCWCNYSDMRPPYTYRTYTLYSTYRAPCTCFKLHAGDNLIQSSAGKPASLPLPPT